MYLRGDVRARKTWPLPYTPTADAATCPLTAWECENYCIDCFLGLCEYCPEDGCQCWHADDWDSVE